ncbi:unnamed protein product [Rotaria socialis]
MESGIPGIRRFPLAFCCDIWLSYVITGVLYLVTNKNLVWSHKEVVAFYNTLENPIELIDTTGGTFRKFFDLLKHVVEVKFVIDCYHELVQQENQNVTSDQVRYYLGVIVDKLQRELYVGVLPSNYCALTCFDCQILLNGAQNSLFYHMVDMINWTWNLSSDTDTQVQYWAALLIIILHEISHIMCRMEIPSGYNIMTATTPQKLLNGKHIKETGNQLEFLLFGGIAKSIGDLDAIYLLQQTSWDLSSVEEFQIQFKDRVNKDIFEQTMENQSNRLELPGKRDELDVPERDEHDYDNRINIGGCATSIYQPHVYLFDESRKSNNTLLVLFSACFRSFYD